MERPQERTFGEIVSKSLGYARGYVKSWRFERRVPVLLWGPLKIVKKNGSISVGARSSFHPNAKLSCCGVDGSRHARIKIGRYCSIGDRTEIHAAESVEIGDRVSIAWDCVIMDRGYHSPDGGDEKVRPVLIGDNVWICCRAIILKGVTIGEGATVAAGAVVTKDVPPFTFVAGIQREPLERAARRS